MTTPILSNIDVEYIMGADKAAVADRVRYAEILYNTLMDAARGANLRGRFWEDIYHGQSTRFVVSRFPVRARYTGTFISVEDIINEQSVLDRFEKDCGKYVQASYDVEDSHHINVYLEFVPQNKSILNPEDEVSSVTIPMSPSVLEELHNRRLAKETGW